MFNLSHASMPIKVQYMTKWCTPLYLEVTDNQRNPFLSFVFHNDWLQNHCWLSVRSMTPNFVVVVSVLLPIWGYAISVHFC